MYDYLVVGSGLYGTILPMRRRIMENLFGSGQASEYCG